LLDLLLTVNVICKEIARDLDLLLREIEVGPEEPDEETRHLGIRGREADLVAIFRALGPIEHAPRQM
jgi:hypothetical protein